MRIIDFPHGDEAFVEKAARILTDGFRIVAPDCWDTHEKALREVRRCAGKGRFGLAALGESDELVGWIGGIESYHGRAWELHPLVVQPDRQRSGIGRKLVEQLELRVADRGAFTLWVGTDDMNNMTSIGGDDLFPRVIDKLRKIRNFKDHPYSFYLKCGFEIVGVLPNVNGRGKHDILMAKSISGNSKK